MRSNETTMDATGASGLRKGAARRTVAVTGADSALGRQLVSLMEQDPTVGRIIALDVVSPSSGAAKTRYYELDLTQPTAAARMAEILQAESVQTFVHLAFLSNPSRSAAWAHELESVGTMHAVQACREAAVNHFVARSSTLLYGAHRSNPSFISEDHPLRGMEEAPFFKDKIEAEREIARFAQEVSSAVVTVLRLAPIVGPSVHNVLSRWVSRRLVPVLMGYDPLMQVVHELDAVYALKLSLDRPTAGVFNVVAPGVLRVSTALRLAGRFAVPVPRSIALPLNTLLWTFHFAEAPESFLDFLKYPCVAEGGRAVRALGFSAAYTTRDAILDFTGALRLREARLLHEAR